MLLSSYLGLQKMTNIMGAQFNRFMNTSTVKMSASELKSNLAKLRKKTGYPFGNCKKALEVNENNLEKAEKWLSDQAREFGWSKAMKMESRNTPQGLVGIALDNNYAALIEMNCETDFVAKNEKFQKLVDLVAKTCLHHSKVENPSPKSTSKVFLDGREVGQLSVPGNQDNIADQVVRAVGMVGEKLVVRRAALVCSAPPILLSAFTHPATNTTATALMGKYGAVMAYTATNADSTSANLAKQLCQHIIGMNPAKLEASAEDLPPATPVAQEKPSEDEAEQNDGEQQILDKGEEDETIMMRQSFLLDADRTVADVVAEGGIKMMDFVRFECGESLNDQEEITTEAAQASG